MASGSQNMTTDKARLLSTQSGTSKFWRGDNTWSNVLIAEQMSLDLKSTSTANWTALHLFADNTDNGATIFVNGSARTDDGGANMMTIRNDVGDLRLNNNTTITGTLYLSRTTDAEGTADNKPALIIGTLSGAHLEFDGNEIMAKGSATTTSTLYLNNNGGQTYFGGNISCASILTVRAENSTTEGGQICLAADPNHSAYSANLDVCNNYFRIHSNGKERISIQLTDGGDHNLNGNVYATGEFVSKTMNGLRIKNIILRNDSSDVYFLVATNSNTPGDNWNSLRPFSFNIGTGRVTMSNGANIGYTNTGYSLSVNTMIANDHVYSRNALYTNGNVNILYNNTWYPVIRNYGNANITMNACSGTLHLGYENTVGLWFGSSGSQKASLDAYHLSCWSTNPVADPHTGAAIEVREVGCVGASDGAEARCPRIGFHWGNRVAAWLGLLADGWFKLGRENNAYYGLRTGSHVINGTTQSTGRIYANEWIQFDNWTGLYSPNNNAHFLPNNTSTYGVWRIDGTRSGYYGILFGPDSSHLVVMDQGTYKGLFQENPGHWILCYRRDTNRVGIDTSEPSYKLHVVGNLYASDSIVTGNQMYAYSFLTHGSGGENTIQCRYGSKVLYFYANSGAYGIYSDHGICFNCSSMVWYGITSGSSSYLIKENILSLTESDAKKLLLLNPVTFNYKQNWGNQERSVGLIAEEVEHLIPEAVDIPDNYDEEAVKAYDGTSQRPTPKGLKYTHFIPYLIKLAQMQQKEIDQLRNELNSLKSNI